MDILLRAFFVGVVAAIGQHHQFTVEKMAVECHALVHMEEETPVRVND
jgi:hypothetical protein